MMLSKIIFLLLLLTLSMVTRGCNYNVCKLLFHCSPVGVAGGGDSRYEQKSSNILYIYIAGRVDLCADGATISCTKNKIEIN